MGAIVSCVRFLLLSPPTFHIYFDLTTNKFQQQIAAIFDAIGSCLMAIVNGIGAVCHAIISGIVTVFDVIISCLTCGYVGRRRRMGGMRMSTI